MENKSELIEKARQAKSVEELNDSIELSDEELGNVSGGGFYYNDGRLVVVGGEHCADYKCGKCGSLLGESHGKYCDYYNKYYMTGCKTCEYMTEERGIMLCNHPENRKK